MLKSRGCRHIVKIQDRFTDEVTVNAERLFLDVLYASGITQDAASTFYHTRPGVSSLVQSGMQAAEDIFRTMPDTDAIFVKNGPQLYGMLATLRKLNKRVPEDLTLITMDNTWMTEHAPVPVFGIDQRLDKIAASAYTMLKKRITSGQWKTPQRKVVETELFKSGSYMDF